jgi:hypothetical protein
MSEDYVRVELHGALEGHYILVDPEEITFGLIADFRSGNADRILDSLALCVRGGDLPRGTDRAGLRRLTIPRIGEVIKGVGTLSQNQKS